VTCERSSRSAGREGPAQAENAGVVLILTAAAPFAAPRAQALKNLHGLFFF